MEEEKQLSLYKAINDNKPWIAIAILKVYPQLLTYESTSGETLIMMAIKRGCSSEYIAKIIEMTPDGGLSLRDKDGNNALHMVATFGNIELAQLLLMKCPYLVLIRNNKEELPIHIAVKRGHRDMKDYLLKMAKQQGDDDPFVGINSEDLLQSAISASMNDVIIALSYNNPDLVFKCIGKEEESRDQPVEDAKSRLHKAIVNDKILAILAILKEHPELITARLTTSGERPIMVAAKRGSKLSLINLLIESASDVELAAMTDNSGNTVLHTMAIFGNIRVAKMLLTKCPNLLLIQNNSGDTPISVSIKHGHQDMTQYLFDKATGGRHNNPFGGEANVDVICAAIRGGMYRVAYWLCRKYEKFLVEGSSVLEALAEDPSAFRGNATPLSCWKAALVQTINCIFRKDFSPNNLPRELVSHTCMHVESVGYEKASSIFKEPFLLAARNGVEDIVKQILWYHPDAINFVDEDNHSIFHLAVMYRHKNIFKLVYPKNVEVSRRLLSMPDKKGNNALHLAGYPALQNKLDESSRVILQMQRELKWFKELENLLLPRDIKLKNDLGKTPLTIFNDEHKDLVATEIQWMNGMASACSVAAPLIATVAFAAAITVPGGNNSDGLPMFYNNNSFMVFAVSNALALFASIASVLSFLSIFTSRYGVDDFLYALPNRLIIGLISLFISAISLMIAFAATLFLVFGQENSKILVPIIVFSCAPVILYTILQLPSLLNMIKSTYGRKLLV